ncbi:Lsr2 family DNA-binding protein [Jatrophihabitans sp. YIM 134969]
MYAWSGIDTWISPVMSIGHNGLMQITIDSNEPLADVMRVVGSIYNVTLTADGRPSISGARRRGNKAPSATTKSKSWKNGSTRSSAANSGAYDPKVVRQWAMQNGHEVSARGSLPAAVLQAYEAANSN